MILLYICHKRIKQKSRDPTQIDMEYLYNLEGVYQGILKVEWLDALNFAMIHKGIPSIYSCLLSNNSDKNWESVELYIDGNEWIKPSKYHTDLLEANRTIDVSTLNLHIEPQKLLELTESLKTTTRIHLSIAGEEITSYEIEVQLMPYNHWVGSRIHPELLASFVTPNHPMIAPILVEAAKFMERWTGNSALTEYQTQDPNTARLQVAAVYEALRSQALIYATPPATFEHTGQRIRLVDQVLTEKLGTCLDLTLLFASCLEAMGLHPLLVLVPGHIFLGVWLEDKYYPSTTCDDESVLYKGISRGINELVLIESTALTSSEAVGFEDAVEQITLRMKGDLRLEFFVDVYRCRLAGIRPLPHRSLVEGQWVVELEGIEHTNATSVVYQLDKIKEDDLKGSSMVTKQTIWERKLLDLTLRNSLINIRMGKRILPLITFDVGTIEDLLQEGKQYSILPKPDHLEANTAEKGQFYSSIQLKAHEAFIAEESKQGRIYSYIHAGTFDDSIKNIYRTSRNALEENGANSLFLSLGLLEWYESEVSTKAHYAPILLLPVDILRKSGGYTIRLRDEDPMLNITLVELLKQEFAIELRGLDPLPQDEKGLDVHKVLAIIRSHIHDMKGWRVTDDAMLGLFSFSKFVMWNDIHSNAAKLAEHPIVLALMNQALSPNTLVELPEIDAREVDRNQHPSEYALPIDVDSSQLEAVLEAGQGRSFVLHGPPGTGKSQTITNMIANALYQGKRVLFVAEKMAALSVVQKRLERIGLDPFCLELHSNKATKAHILDQLKQALELEHYISSPEYERISSELLNQRQELIAYTQALHQQHDLGLSLHDCISRYLSIPTDALDISIDLLKELTPESFKARLELIGESDTIRQVSGDPASHPLRGLHILQFTSETRGELEQLLQEWRTLWEQLLGMQSASLAERISFDLQDYRDSYLCLASIACCILRAPSLSPSLLSLPQEEVERMTQTLELGRRQAELSRDIREQHSPNLLEVDASALSYEWRAANEKWFIPRFFARRSLHKRLRTLGAKTSTNDIGTLLEQLQECQGLKQQLKDQEGRLSSLFSSITERNTAAWEAMQQSLHASSNLQATLLNYAQGRELNILDLLQKLQPTLGEGFPLVRQTLEPQLRAIAEVAERLKIVEEKLTSTYAAVLPNELIRSCALSQADRWMSNLGLLKPWHLWCTYREKLSSYGLTNVATLLECGISGDVASQAFAKGIYHKQAELIINEDDRLRLFNGLLFEQAIEKYRELTNQFMQLTKHELYARLAARVPRMTMEPVASSELGILKRNIANGGRGTSIRKLMDQIPNLLMRLCPCMLMSPMSAAQYISLESEPFDLVIFDEASQMPTSEAVGAIARGRSLVVVGDPKQMPPTSFFASSQVEEEEVELDDMESILDECIALSMPSRYLTWHYRSKHESLIAFSNRNYYEGRLFTFPSVDNRQSKVSLVHIKGIYDKGRTRSNKAEASAIVTEVLRRLRDPELARYSIGIVSFSQVQQNLIEDLLLEALGKNPELEQKAFSGEEPIFIKNLENVQGDERDVILFSVGYGPDAEGKVSMNFGPLNNKGGERRLNVAVSRSRYEMIVFSSLRSEQIDLKRTQAKGVEGLKRFLEFAESGKLVDVHPTSKANDTSSLALADIVAQELRQRGYQVDLNIGSSQFRVDLGVIDTDYPERYALGILFDGASYQQTKTVRDREIVQPTVLGLLKWQTMRIWSLDWYEDKERVLARIEERIKNPLPATPQPLTVQPHSAEQAKVLDPSRNNSRHASYQAASISAQPKGGVDSLLASKGKVAEQVLKIIQTEQPITSNLIGKRLATIWQLTRVTPRVQALLESILIDYHLDPRAQEHQEVYWLDETAMTDYTYYRTESDRDILDCPLQEVMNAALAVLEEQISMSQSDLKRSAANLLGFSRMGANLEAMTQCAIDHLAQNGQVEIIDQSVRISN